MSDKLKELEAFVKKEFEKLAFAIKQKLHPSTHDVVDGEVNAAVSNLAGAFSSTDHSSEPVASATDGGAPSPTAVGAQSVAPDKTAQPVAPAPVSGTPAPAPAPSTEAPKADPASTPHGA